MQILTIFDFDNFSEAQIHGMKKRNLLLFTTVVLVLYNNLPCKLLLAFPDTMILIDMRSEATLKLENHVDFLTWSNVIVRNCLLIGQGFSAENQTNHGHVNAFFLLKSLLDM